MVDLFLLEEAIGVGGMGAVFRALDTRLERQVALKLLPPDQALDPEVVQRFYQEGRAAARLDHENIARVYSIGQYGTLHYIAFEYIEGVTVRQRVESLGALPVREAINIAIQIAHALVHARGRSVVHRDIKPSNIIITPRGQAKLVDMGLARRFEREGDHGLTQSGMTLGTFDYISPEQARDPRDVDVRSDLYSLGCTLFHMLTGRPPFPGGTVLQKLIQHQEEQPADVRELNPLVPPELAAVIGRLMAKNRERRYQTPENLVRDLLAVAGRAGLPYTDPLLRDWPPEARRPGWERHLVWGLPAFGFIVVVSGLAWWGHEISNPSLPAERRFSGAAPVIRQADGGARFDQSPPVNRSAPKAAESAAPIATLAPPAPRNIPVSASEDLLDILASAPRHAVVILSDDGPYRVGGRARTRRASTTLVNPDLTIKADPGAHPVLELSADARADEQGAVAILNSSGGHVVLEGIEFNLDTRAPGGRLAAIRSENTELTIRGCSFRRQSSAEVNDLGVAALHLRSSALPIAAGVTAERPAAVFLDTCHIDGGQVAIHAQGAADIALRDCSIGAGQPIIWLDNGRSSSPVPVDLRLEHTSLRASSGPVFRFEGTQARVWVDDSVIAAGPRVMATLVQVDDPRNLVWRGRGNVFSRIGVYESLSSGDEIADKIADFAAWSEGGGELRETGTIVVNDPVWEAVEPGRLLASEKDNPTREFLLNAEVASRTKSGARHGPFGAVLSSGRLAERTAAVPPPEPPAARSTQVERPASAIASAKPDDNSLRQVASVTQPEPRNSPPAAPPPNSNDDDAATDEAKTLSNMPPMTTTPAEPPKPPVDASEPPPADVAPQSGPRRDEPPRIARATADVNPPDQARRSNLDDEDVVRSTQQFLSMLNKLGAQGGTLRIAAGVELDLPTIQIDGTGRFQFIALAGKNRPILRFRSSQPSARSPAEWTALLNLRSGSLHLQGLDVVITEEETQGSDRIAAAGLFPGSELTMTDCTLTIAAHRPGATAFVAQPVLAAANSRPSDGATTRTAIVRLRDCFLRSGGDAAIVTAARGLNLEMSNVLVSTEGSLLHAFGGTRAGQVDSPSVKVRLDQVTARVKGGLVHLDATADEPRLPFVACAVENSIVSTANRDDPLFQLDGRDPREELGDKIRWEARKVAYDRIKTYRRDEVARTGFPPRNYDRADWTSSFLPKDESPILGDVKFMKEATSSSSAWKLTRDDLRLATDSPVAQNGPELSRIPQAPAEEE
jgi:serine/threonine-protein kinase